MDIKKLIRQKLDESSKEKLPGTKSVADKMVNAEKSFIETIRNISKCTEEQATKVFKIYLKEKIIKRDLQMGKYNVKHGAFLDKEVIQNAINSEIK